MKKNIPASLRQTVWITYNSEKFHSKCHVSWCKNIITPFTFEVGHNKPESKGGTTTIDNLLPICGWCNRSMGNRYTITEYSESFTPRKSSPNSLSNIIPIKSRFRRFLGKFKCFRSNN
jgi:5-methylcytosine-specific restriction endonuclease McrA